MDCEYTFDSRLIFSKRFIFNQHFMNDILCIFSDMLLIFFAQLIRIDWFAVFYYNSGRCYLWKVRFEDVCGVVDGDWNNRAFGFCCNLEASLMEWEQIQFILAFVSGSLREDTDGNAGFYFFYCCENGFQTLLDVLSVKEETVKITHPCGQEWNLFHFFFCNVSGADRTAGIGKENVEVTSVVSDIEYRSILWYVLFSDDSDFRSGDPQDKAKYCLDDAQRADIFCHGREFANDPLDQKDRNRENQVSDHHDTDEDKSYHY